MNDDRRLVPSPNAVFRPLGDGGVILAVDTGAYFEVNSSGRFLWEAMESNPTVATLSREASAHYGLDVTDDVVEFVRALDERQLLDAP